MRGPDRARPGLLPRPSQGHGRRVPRRAPRRDPAPTPRLTPRLLALVGPTGTGKSATAIELALLLNGEIVGCDALQVYRGLDAATAKPTSADRDRVPHHLIDLIDPTRDISMADWVDAAERAIDSIAGRGRVPIVAGGAGLYLRGLLRGVLPAPARVPEVRARLRRMAERFGSPRLHRWLAALDRESAERLPPGDAQRLVRALEIALAGDRTWSERLRCEGTWETARERYPVLKIGLDTDRERLNARLAERVDAFYERGLVEEVRSLLRAGVPRRANAFKAIGYREVLAALERGDDPRRCRDEIVRNTRRYAKRQRTWFRGEPEVQWLDAALGPAELARRVVAIWNG